MNTKKVIAAIVLSLFTVPAFASAYTYSADDYPSATETLVEGHTVFSVIQATMCIENYGDYGTNNTTGESWDNEEVVDCPDEQDSDFDVSWDVRANVTVQRLGTAVAVLVRDRVKPFYPSPAPPVDCVNNRDVVATILYENPGVLWFNDQFLVGDDLDIVEARVDANVDVCEKDANVVFDPSELEWRYPCGGYVLATQAGNPDPRPTITTFSYEESYQIVDPNDNTWVIDKYGVAPLTGVGVDFADVEQDQVVLADSTVDVPSNGEDADGDGAADGDLRAVVGEPSSAASAYGVYLGRNNMWTVPIMNDPRDDPGPTSGQSCTPYDDPTIPTSDGSTALYNAVLFFFFEDLVLGSGGALGVKIHGDGAPDSGDTTGCERDPANDGWESAPYDTCPGNSDNAEGNSHAFNPNTASQGPIHIHPTAAVDLYFSDVAPPTVGTRKFAIFDTVGSGAPVHMHPAGVPSGTFDDRVYADACLDYDYYYADQTYVFNGDGSAEYPYWNGTYSEAEEERFRGGTNSEDPSSLEGDGEAAPGDGANGDDCSGGYQGGWTGWEPSGEGSDGSYVPTSEAQY